MRRIPAWVLPVVAVVVVALGLAGWLGFSARTAGAVTVAWVPSQTRCTGHALGRIHGGSATEPGTVIRVRRNTTCTLLAEVVNGSGHSVRVAALTGAYLGPASGLILTAIHPQGTAGDRMDARWRPDRVLAAGASFRFPIEVGFHSRGCSQAFTDLRGKLTAQVQVLGVGHQRGDTGGHLWVTQTGPSPGCRTAE